MDLSRSPLLGLVAAFAVPLVAACGASTQTASGGTGACAATASSARSPALDALAQERIAIARKRVDLLRLQYQKGAASLAQLLAAHRDVASAARDSGIRGDALVRALAEYRDAMVASVDLARVRNARGEVNDDDVQVARGALAEAEYWLAEASEREGIAAPPRPTSVALSAPPPPPPPPSASARSTSMPY